MTTLDTRITDVSLPRKRSLMAVATATLAVGGFVGISLALQSVTHRALVALGLVEDSYGQCAQYIAVTACSMYGVRKLFDVMEIKYNGRVVFLFFLVISVLVITLGLSSGFLKVDLLVSFVQMSALCVFAYLQFCKHDSVARLR